MSQSIVINSCFGGFSLSYEGVMHYAKLAGIKLYAFVDARKPDGGIDFRHYVPYNGTGETPFSVHYATQPLNKDGTYSDGSYFSDRDIKRDDPHLVATVRALGDKANGDHAQLKVVKIPDGVKWVIDEYDGSERVEEQHQSWG